MKGKRMAHNESEVDFSGWLVNYNPTKEERLKRLQQDLKRSSKMMNPQYRNAVERNKKRTAYDNMIRKAHAEVNPVKQQEIIDKWCKGFRDND